MSKVWRVLRIQLWPGPYDDAINVFFLSLWPLACGLLLSLVILPLTLGSVLGQLYFYGVGLGLLSQMPGLVRSERGAYRRSAILLMICPVSWWSLGYAYILWLDSRSKELPMRPRKVHRASS